MTLQEIWKELQSYDGEAPRKYDMGGCRVQFYKGAMEIPLACFYPQSPFALKAKTMDELSTLLEGYGLRLDCVEDEKNYKINRAEDGQYLGRITEPSLKLHAERSKALGWEAFSRIVIFHLNLSKGRCRDEQERQASDGRAQRSEHSPVDERSEEKIS